MGTVLCVIEERVGFVGRLGVGLPGFVWTVATALVVPVLAAEDVGIGFMFGIAIAAVSVGGGLSAIVAFRSGPTFGIAMLAAVVIAVCLLFLPQATLQGIYAAALYRHADGDANAGGLGADLLGEAFRPRM